MDMLVFFIVVAFASVAQSRAENDSIAALSIPPSTYWDGIDGKWSTFHVQVGGQVVRLLPGSSSSAGTSTWVVIDEGCTVANPNLTNCDFERGYLFHRNQSTSWSTRHLSGDGLYSLTTFVEGDLGLTGNAYYGFDTINPGLPGSGLPNVQNQVIAGFGTSDFWLGSLGLSPYPFNFSGFGEPQPSLLSTLFNQSLIPSLSWSYTAGANYKSTPVLGSLTLGGYDTTRFVPNGVSFPFGADFSRDLLVKLRSIKLDTFGSPPLLASEINIFIDSMVSQMWLPVDVCQQFEQAFNLTWNTTTALYILDESTHNALLAKNPTFTFTIANGSDRGDSTVDIAFPYAAFDLNITQPDATDPERRYFPLKQAQNSSQYVLGRVFLQEAYLIADYGRQNFSVSQALFPQTNVQQNIVAIHTPGYKADQSGSSGLSSGAIAGIVVAAVVVLALVVGVMLWFRRRSNLRKGDVKHASHDIDGKSKPFIEVTPELDQEETAVRELDGWHGYKPELEVHDGSSGRHELPTPVKVHEIASHDAVELEAPLG